jgi:hypothetical protein
MSEQPTTDKTTTGSSPTARFARRFKRRPAPATPTPPALTPGESLLIYAAADTHTPPHRVLRLVNHATYALELRDGVLRVLKDKRQPAPRGGERVVMVHHSATEKNVAQAAYEIRHATFVVRLNRDGTESVLYDRNYCGTFLQALERAQFAVTVHDCGVTELRGDNKVWSPR